MTIKIADSSDSFIPVLVRNSLLLIVVLGVFWRYAANITTLPLGLGLYILFFWIPFLFSLPYIISWILGIYYSFKWTYIYPSITVAKDSIRVNSRFSGRSYNIDCKNLKSIVRYSWENALIPKHQLDIIDEHGNSIPLLKSLAIGLQRPVAEMAKYYNIKPKHYIQTKGSPSFLWKKYPKEAVFKAHLFAGQSTLLLRLVLALLFMVLAFAGIYMWWEESENPSNPIWYYILQLVPFFLFLFLLKIPQHLSVFAQQANIKEIQLVPDVIILYYRSGKLISKAEDNVLDQHSFFTEHTVQKIPVKDMTCIEEGEFDIILHFEDKTTIPLGPVFTSDFIEKLAEFYNVSTKLKPKPID